MSGHSQLVDQQVWSKIPTSEDFISTLTTENHLHARGPAVETWLMSGCLVLCPVFGSESLAALKI